MIDNKDIKYVASRYRRDLFNVGKGWKRLGIAPSFVWHRITVAASVAAIVFLSATAAILYHTYSSPEVAQPEMELTPVNIPEEPLYVEKVIDFENAPLDEVVRQIEEVYQVEVENVPADPGNFRLSLHYEGNAVDLVETVNDILETEMIVKEK